MKLGGAKKVGPIEVIAARDDAELDTFVLNEQGTSAALVWNVGGRSELAFVDLAKEKMTPAPKLPQELLFTPTYSRDGKQLVGVSTGPAAPPDVWVLDVASGAWRQVTQSPHEGVALDELVRPELVRFPAHDGLELSGWLYRPRGGSSGPGPVVLSFHGGPEGQEVPVLRGDYQAFLATGIAVFAPNVRGSAGFGKKFLTLESLKKRGIATEYILFEDEGHGWQKTENRIRSTVSITRWFERYLRAR